jgi:3-deoxy-manno-octulosonate cytidylyltransferase (CMP-KDO synthetase)
MPISDDILGVIPARWDSKRFPGKPLALLKDKPLIQWVWEKANQVQGVDNWLVATDDRRIRESVIEFGGEAVMTSTDHPSGSDRIAEVARERSEDIIINIQGDEPALDPAAVEAMINALHLDENAGVGTAAFPIKSVAELDDPNVVKVAFDLHHRALLFSRSPIPHIRDQRDQQSWIAQGVHYRHLGIYAYRRDVLMAFSQWEPGPLELAENLEQLRFLERGITMVCALVDRGSPGVDTPDDLRRLEQMIQ